MPYPVNGKTALITGAGSGINLCFAKILLENGCNVLIADVALRPEAQKVVDQYSSSPRAIFVKTDVADWSQLQNAFDVAEAEFGEIDIVCPGAGIFEPPNSSFWFPPGTPPSGDSLVDSRYQSIDVNLVHPIRATQMAISHFLKVRSSAEPKRKKHVLLVSSIAGHMPVFACPLYAVTKHGISAMVQSLGQLDEALGIRVVGIAPGIVKTAIWLDSKEKMTLLDEEADEWVMPEDVAKVMLALVEQDKLGERVDETDAEKQTIPIAGGTLIEVSKSVRKILVFGDPGPVGRPGNTVGNLDRANTMILDMLSNAGK